MINFINKIPLWLVNAISVISGILTIISAIISFISFHNDGENKYKWFFLVMCLFVILLLNRIRKYQKLSFDLLHTTSLFYKRLTHDSRNLYFDIMKEHKDGTETISSLTNIYQTQLATILGYLCQIMEKYCRQNVSACIKLISQPYDSIYEATLSTFCRYSQGNDRGMYEKDNVPIKICDNTDFMNIIDPNHDYNTDYFYQGNLKEYDKELRKNGTRYKNTNTNWENDYIVTIVVPIQIEHKRLYDSSENNSYNVIGFLCVDSKSSSAFVKKQEETNVDIVKSFADIIYILLAQYQHYLKKISVSE